MSQLASRSTGSSLPSKFLKLLNEDELETKVVVEAPLGVVGNV